MKTKAKLDYKPEILTPEEKLAVDRVLEAIDALPASICLEVEEDFDGEEPTLVIRKLISSGHATFVAGLFKDSLAF